jgi:hypothetical protein
VEEVYGALALNGKGMAGWSGRSAGKVGPGVDLRIGTGSESVLIEATGAGAVAAGVSSIGRGAVVAGDSPTGGRVTGVAGAVACGAADVSVTGSAVGSSGAGAGVNTEDGARSASDNGSTSKGGEADGDMPDPSAVEGCNGEGIFCRLTVGWGVIGDSASPLVRVLGVLSGLE